MASSPCTAMMAAAPGKASYNTWHKRLGHHNVQIRQQLARTEGSGVLSWILFFSVCDTCHVNKSDQQAHPTTANRDGITARLQIVTMDLLGAYFAACY